MNATLISFMNCNLFNQLNTLLWKIALKEQNKVTEKKLIKTVLRSFTCIIENQSSIFKGGKGKIITSILEEKLNFYLLVSLNKFY